MICCLHSWSRVQFRVPSSDPLPDAKHTSRRAEAKQNTPLVRKGRGVIEVWSAQKMRDQHAAEGEMRAGADVDMQQAYKTGCRGAETRRHGDVAAMLDGSRRQAGRRDTHVAGAERRRRSRMFDGGCRRRCNESAEESADMQTKGRAYECVDATGMLRTSETRAEASEMTARRVGRCGGRGRPGRGQQHAEGSVPSPAGKKRGNETECDTGETENEASEDAPEDGNELESSVQLRVLVPGFVKSIVSYGGMLKAKKEAAGLTTATRKSLVGSPRERKHGRRRA
ncbi:hypothetical protein C8R44DRAFT_733218 [Mycena epipterygia]|nr:hypothetical protein C8R44DRAFT_733218 [Mycena epipterygia]